MQDALGRDIQAGDAILVANGPDGGRKSLERHTVTGFTPQMVKYGKWGKAFHENVVVINSLILVEPNT